MKKVALCMVITIFLIGCGRVDEVSQKVMDDIDSLGEVTLEDEDVINKTMSTYTTLTDKQKEQITNYAVLLDAQDTIDKLKAKEQEELIAKRDEIVEYALNSNPYKKSNMESQNLENVEEGKGYVLHTVSDEWTGTKLGYVSDLDFDYKISNFKYSSSKSGKHVTKLRITADVDVTNAKYKSIEKGEDQLPVEILFLDRDGNVQESAKDCVKLRIDENGCGKGSILIEKNDITLEVGEYDIDFTLY